MGTFGDGANKIEGTISGSTFIGTFEEYGRTGEVELELLPDGKSISGKWRYTGESLWGQWNAVRKMQ